MALTRPMKRFFQVAAVALVLFGAMTGIFFWQAVQTIRIQKAAEVKGEVQRIP